MARGDYFSYPMIESRAQDLLMDYVQAYPGRNTAPIPIEDLVEDYLDLGILWEPLPEEEGRMILAKLEPRSRRVTFNETHLDVFDGTPHLYRTVLAHEVGHWDLHAERGALVQNRRLPGIGDDYPVYRSGTQTWDERNAHRFAACLLAPQELLVEAVRECPPRKFTDLYRLRDILQVTVTALQIRLEELGLLYIDEDGNFHRDRQTANGQLLLF